MEKPLQFLFAKNSDFKKKTDNLWYEKLYFI